jgi:hypothetical protein
MTDLKHVRDPPRTASPPGELQALRKVPPGQAHPRSAHGTPSRCSRLRASFHANEKRFIRRAAATHEISTEVTQPIGLHVDVNSELTSVDGENRPVVDT